MSLGAWALFADQIVMKNGDRVTGSIVKKDEKTLTIKSEHFGLVTLPWDQVTSVTADKPVNVTLTGGQTVQGTLAPAGDKVEVTAGGTKQTVAPADIAAIRDEAEQKAYLRMLKPGWGDLWTINANLNIAGTSGNAQAATITTPVNAVRVTRTDKTTAYFNFIKASATVNRVSEATAEAARGGVSYSRNIHPKLFLTAFNDYEYDRFQSLDLRVVVGGGLGYIAWKGENGRLDLVGGASYNREQFAPLLMPDGLTRKSAEIYWGDDFNYKLSTRMSLVQSYRMFNNMSNTGELRQNADISLTTALTKWLTWNVALSDRYLSNPLPGRKKNDFLYTMGLGIVIKR
jgi:putative salt-induced outer membrane protein YdiY